MPNWKKVIVSGSDAVLKSVTVTNGTGSTTLNSNADTLIFTGSAYFTGSTTITGNLVGNGLTYPTADGTYASQVLQTNAAGNLTFGNVETTFDTIYNGEATTLVKGTPVYITGTVGGSNENVQLILTTNVFGALNSIGIGETVYIDFEYFTNA